MIYTYTRPVNAVYSPKFKHSKPLNEWLVGRKKDAVTKRKKNNVTEQDIKDNDIHLLRADFGFDDFGSW